VEGIMADTVEGTQAGSFSGALGQYAIFWIFAFVSNLLITLIPNAIWKVPLFHVVNVQLSISFTILFVGSFIFVMSLLFSNVLPFFGKLAAIVTFILLMWLNAYAPVLAFKLYAALGGIDLGSKSLMLNHFNAVETLLYSPLANAVSNVGNIPIDQAFFGIERGASFLSSVLGIFGFVVGIGGWMRAGQIRAQS
jgi:hypothetical protein